MSDKTIKSVRCKVCSTLLSEEEIERNDYVCPNCGADFWMTGNLEELV